MPRRSVRSRSFCGEASTSQARPALSVRTRAAAIWISPACRLYSRDTVTRGMPRCAASAISAASWIRLQACSRRAIIAARWLTMLAIETLGTSSVVFMLRAPPSRR